MDYDVIALVCEQLTYRQKLRLAQSLIQSACKGEEIENPQSISDIKKIHSITAETEIDIISYVFDRLSKLKPNKVKALTNSIKAMFQFQGAISDKDVEGIIKELQVRKLIKVTGTKVSYK